MAHLADWNFVLCRTGAPDSRHRGISYLLVPMDQPGIEVRPIRDLTGGDTDFCEVFYDGARTAVENVVGEVDGGWRVAMSTVTFERGLSTVGYQLSFEEELRSDHRTGAAQRPCATTPSCASIWRPRGAGPGSCGGTSCVR